MATSPTTVSQPTSAAAMNPGLAIQGRNVDSVIRRLVPGSPMVGTGAKIVAIGNTYNVDPAAIVGFAYAETSLGTAGQGRISEGRNAFGIKGRSYASYDDAIEDVAKLLSGPLYFGEGLYTIRSIIAKYSPASDGNNEERHSSNIARVYAMFGADRPSDPTKADIRLHKTGDRTTVDSLIEDGAGAVKDVTVGTVSAIGDLLALIVDPKLWLRIGSMILGTIAMALGALFAFKGAGKSARPVGILIALFGFGWLWAGVKNINPLTLVRDVVGMT